MRTSLVSWVAALACALLLSACGDGSVRSPAAVGSGELLSIDLQCFRPDGGQCSNPPRVNVGGTVNFRVIGTFENGSEQDITASDRIEFSLNAPDGEAAFVTGNRGQVRGISPTEDGAPVLIAATDREQEGGSDSNTLEVVGGIPQIANVFADPNNTGVCDDLANGQNVAAGQALQLRALIRFVDANGQPVNIPNECVAQRDGLTWSAQPANPDGSSAVTPNTGVFSGQNEDPENDADFNVTATLIPPESENPELDESSASATINVAAAELVADSLRVTAAPPRIIVGGSAEIEATALFDTGEQELRLDVQLDSLELVDDAADFVSIQDAADDDNLTPTVFGDAATPDGGPAILEGSFRGQTDTASLEVLAADFGSIELIPVGIASFEDAGVFAGLPDEEALALRQNTANDAAAFGMNVDGQVPFCDPDLVEDCPNSALDRHQTLPGKGIPYAVVAYLQDDPEQERATLLDDLAISCDDGRRLDVSISEGDEVIDVRTMLPIGEAPEDGEAPAMAPARTPSGLRIALVEGLTEGVSKLTARLGGDPDNSARDSGINCRSAQTGEKVADAEQDVSVGVFDEDGEPRAIQRTTFNIDKNFTCVGFTNATQAVNGEEIRGRDKLLTSLTYEVAGDDGDTDQIIINANQERATGFRVIGGPATNQHNACRNDEDPAGETDPSITITDALLAERGVIEAEGATGLAANCAAASFDPEVAPPNFDDSPGQRAATVLVLPVDDAILRGESALSGEEVDGLCGELGTLFTLPIGQFAGMQGQGLLLETVGLLEQLLGPILNNEIIEDDVSTQLEAVLNELSGGVLGPLLTDALAPLTDQLLPLLGLGDGESPTGFSLLPTLVEGLGEVTDELNAQLIAAGGGEEPPPTTDPGDPFNGQGMMRDPGNGDGGGSPIPGLPGPGDVPIPGLPGSGDVPLP